MSYFDFFTKNILPNNSCEAINGTCYDMCPEEEVIKRQKESMVHVLEVVKHQRRLVKSYSRPAADTNVAVPRLLRPYHVLRDTVRYLLLEVTKRSDVPSHIIYDFINDRLRAVRLDMTVQRLSATHCAILLDPMVRFHMYFGYKLCELPLKDFNPVLNQKYLLECLKWYLTSIDSDCKHTQEELGMKLSGLDIRGYQLKNDRVLMESLYILTNLDDINPLRRYLSLPKALKSEPRLQLAYRIAVANLRGNYIEVCGLLERLCPLAFCALTLYLPVVQRRALEVLSHAYSSKTLTVPVEVICRWLRFGNVADAAAAFEHYGVAMNGNVARFDKQHFRRDAATMQPRKLLQLQDKLDLTIDHVFTY